MNVYWLFLVLIFASVATGCKKSKPVSYRQPVTNPGTYNPLPPPQDPPPAPPVHSLAAVHEAIGNNVGGYYVALPPDYDSSQKNYPLLVFLHGGGERGNGTTDLPLVLLNATPKRIHQKKFPVTFQSGDSSFSFIVVIPQFRDWPRPVDVRAVIERALGEYRVNTQRIYLSGLSMGGGAIWDYTGAYGDYVAAIVPICAATWPDSTLMTRIASRDIPAWTFHNNDDVVVIPESTKRIVRFVNTKRSQLPIKLTIWETGGHDAWTKASDPEYREENLNIYEWMLQFARN